MTERFQCPGQSYVITRAVCRSRQRANFPLCPSCSYRPEAWAPGHEPAPLGFPPSSVEFESRPPDPEPPAGGLPWDLRPGEDPADFEGMPYYAPAPSAVEEKEGIPEESFVPHVPTTPRRAAEAYRRVVPSVPRTSIWTYIGALLRKVYGWF